MRNIIRQSAKLRAPIFLSQNTPCQRVAGGVKNKSKKRLPEKRFRLLSVPLFTRLQPNLRRSGEQQVAERAAMNLFFFTPVKII
jgi:hypothetical protein